MTVKDEIVYFYIVYLNDTQWSTFVWEDVAYENAAQLQQSRPEENVRVVRKLDVALTVENIFYNVVWVQRVICFFRGHMWDADRYGGQIHVRNFCWRCSMVKKEKVYERVS